MIDAFKISFHLHNTYKKNSILYSLKSIPLVKKLIPVSLYGNQGLTIFVNVVSAIREFFSAFLGKAIYFALVFLAAVKLHAAPDDSYAHILLFLTLIGGILNTQMFNPTREQYYAVSLMRMDAKKYMLSNYLYFLAKILVGFLVFSLAFGGLCGVPTVICLVVPLYAVEIKLCSASVLLHLHRRENPQNENKLTFAKVAAILLLLTAAFLPPYLGYAVKGTVLCILAALLLVPSAFAFRYVLHCDQYRQICKELLKPERLALGGARNSLSTSEQEQMHKKIALDTTQVSNKTGYRYFNELFMKRHAKLLTRSAKRITIVAGILFAAAIIACKISPGINSQLNKNILTVLPSFLFVMYLINRGKVITQAMFMNCDHSMLAYRFYRQPKTILALFVERLKYVVLINLMPAGVIGLCLPLLLFISGGTDQPLNYLILFVSIISMSVFFSVHNIVLYYLLQPYNVNIEMKSTIYNVINYATYLICYLAAGKKGSVLVFGSVVTAFCLVYIVVAVILAYRLAPKTFRLRQ